MPRTSNSRYLGLVFTITLTSIMGNSLLSPVLPDIVRHFDQPMSAVGLIITATSLPGIFVAPAVGVLADRFGRRIILVPCLALFGVFGIAAALAQSFGQLLLFRFGMGLGSAALINLGVVLIGDRFDGKERTRILGMNSGVLTLALAVFPLAAGILAEIGGWRLAIAPYGIAIPVAVFAWFNLEPVTPGPPTTLRDQLGGAGRELRRPALFLNVIGAGILFSIVFGVLLAALPPLLDTEFGLSAGWRGAVLAVPAVTSSISAFNLRRLDSRFGAARLLIASAASWVLAFAVMGATELLWVLLVGALLYGVGEGVMIPAMQDMALEEASSKHRAIVLAIWTAGARLGQTAGPLVTGLLIGWHGERSAVLAGAAGSAILLVLFIEIRRVSKPLS